MYAIICAEDGNSIYYGPFSSTDAVERYAKNCKLGYPDQPYIVVKLHDSGDTMDA